jgi:GTPase SAR1 family protein
MERSAITVPKPPKRNVIRIKVISMGEAGCGKSCLIKRYCEEKVPFLEVHNKQAQLKLLLHLLQFVPKYISTIGVDFGVKSVMVDNQQVIGARASLDHGTARSNRKFSGQGELLGPCGRPGVFRGPQ